MFCNRFRTPTKYKGNAQQICEQIINDCWNGTFFQTSKRNFSQFWTRDFGMCCESLIKLGYKNKVRMTLNYALSIFQKHNKITTHITPKGKPIDFPNYTPESLAYIIHCLKLLGDKKLIEKYKPFLKQQVKYCYDIAFDPVNGIVRRKQKFSTMRDHYVRDSSMYNNCMLAMLSNDLYKLKLNNPFESYDFESILKKLFWTGSYFQDDLNKENYISGDANIFPFWTKTFTDKQMFKACLKSINKTNLDKPFPLKYTNQRLKHKENSYSFFAPNYEGNTLWLHLGLCFVKTVKMFNKKLALKYINQYTELIEKHKNLLEVFNPDTTPYKTLLYKTDSSMLWAAIYLELIKC